jgi:putative membrane protein
VKKIARSLILSALAFLVVALFYQGIRYQSLTDLVIAGSIFALLSQFVKPVLKLLTIPFNLLTFGLFSVFVSIVIIYLVTLIAPGFSIVPFHFQGVNISGFILPSLTVPWLWSAVLASFLIGLAVTALQFIFR